ncbi:MAG: hypothetical protein R2800_13195 [Flavipsychrobacter sp.]
MKKITLLLGMLMIAGASFACDGDKKCDKKACKHKTECKKGDKKACCKKGDSKKACCKKGAKKDA